MLYHFDFSVEEIHLCNAAQRDESLSTLLRAHRLGDHIVVIPRDVCRLLLDVADLSKAEAAILSRILTEHTQKGGLVRTAPLYVRIASSPVPPHAQGRALNLTIADFLQSKLADRPILLVENVRRDGLLYGELLKAHYDLHNCPPPAYVPMHGGGEDLTTVFLEQIKQKRMVCGIVDTDRFSPHSSLPKLDRLTRLAAQSGWPFAFAAAPPCREAENCLPMNLMMELQCGRGNPHNCHYISIAAHESLQNEDPKHAFWLYTDLKEGVTADAIDKITNLTEKTWFLDKLRCLALDLSIDPILGFGGRVFDQLISDGRHLAALRATTRTKEWRAVFSEFIDFLAWIFAGGRRLAA